MNKVALLLLCVIGTCSVFQINAQNYFEGEITYSIEYLEVPKEMKEVERYLPSEMVLLSKGTKYKTINKIPNKSDQINIMNNFDGSGFLLIDFLGHKIALANDISEVRKANGTYFQSEIEMLQEEKEIMGFECQRAIMVSAGDTTKVFFTKRVLSPEFKYVKLKGLPLEYFANQKGLKMQVVATKLEERTISDAEFLIPSDYKILSKNELEELFKL